MYLLDANELIQAAREYYAFDIAPGFWEWLDSCMACGEIGSIEAVRKELLAGNDQLSIWAKQRPNYFLGIDSDTVAKFAPLTQWAASQDFTPTALNKFAGDAADYLLVAYAAAHDHTVVTKEKPDPHSKKRVKIPDACAAMGVATANLYDVMRATKAKL
ncbi:DUF4411 family protein [Corynebacterium heidelbergense]|uniref:DUF4411 domain-containing protein n=1 Tax=Corynebacterium heidelbergense TaxID=2055947 RepID=A0A364V5N7_9CORY|nr:DUF4411 family protein [Corynebacterium heidelbergense]RAV31947.1 DUF4411 domain-containing protein [Corynebacterium heidelbergense]